MGRVIRYENQADAAPDRSPTPRRLRGAMRWEPTDGDAHRDAGDLYSLAAAERRSGEQHRAGHGVGIDRAHRRMTEADP